MDNSACQKMTVIEIKQTEQYIAIPRGTMFEGKAKSRLSKNALCRLMGNSLVQTGNSLSSTGILYLQLHADYDPGGALKPQDDLVKALLKSCHGYQIMSNTFRNFDDIFTTLLSIPDRTVAHVVILSHGTSTSIQLNHQEELSTDTLQFDIITDQLRRVMLPRSSVCLTACNVGYFDGSDGYDKTQLIDIENSPTRNFGNMLAHALDDRQHVYCTAGVQVSGELSLIALNPSTESTCAVTNPSPFYFGYISMRQAMFRYSKTAGTLPKITTIVGQRS
jgi:hypothetical protein